MNLRGRMIKACHLGLSFSVLSTTFITLLIYVAILISIIVVHEVLPKAPSPSNQLGLDLSTAFRDLQAIAGGPHPYNSHANDAVRSHIFSRVTDIAALHNNVHVADDIISNATWYSGGGVYFEGNNILVKIDGKQPELEAVLFSAHFDSVSTAPGATDDGMAVSTLLQLVGYFAKNTPKRTVIFNINNGEEDGLHGAHAFLEHPWSSLPKLFLNLEGAGAGGRPMLFRTSSTSVTRAFVDVPHPHGSVLSSDAFARGLIRSGTDFSVYVTDGLKGLDLAFYRRRSLYHTKDDSVPSLGGTDALWIMMESSLISGIALTESIAVIDIDDPPVYFDVYGKALAVFPLRTFLIINLVFLIVGPLLVAGSIALVYTRRGLHWSSKGWLRLPVAFVLSVGLTFGLAVLFTYVNPYIVYSSGYTVMASLISMALITLQIPLTLFSSWRRVPQQKSILLLEMYVLWWILLVFDTVLVNNSNIGGLYFITFFHVAAFLALLVTLLEHLRHPSLPIHHQSTVYTPEGPEGASDESREENHSETTPLIQRQRSMATDTDIQERDHFGFWLLEYMILVPFPVILVTQTAAMLVGALPQTLADGSSALLVYLAMALASILIVLPLSPFSHKLHRYLSVGVVLVLIGTGLYNLVAFPFSTASPLKVFFYQNIDLDTGINFVNISGVPNYIDQRIVPGFPSTWNQTIKCSDMAQRKGLRSCQWMGLAPAVVPIKSDWLTFNASLAAPGIARISLKGLNTRACHIYFDHPVTSIRVENTTGEVQSDYPLPDKGITELRLWSRTWDREFVVTAGWQGEETLKGRVSCGWAESLEGRIPAFDEVIGFLPAWAQVTKANEALVEATRKFSV